MHEWSLTCAVKITLEDSRIIKQIINDGVIFAEDCLSALPKLKNEEGNIKVIQTPNNVFLFIKSTPLEFDIHKNHILNICQNYRDLHVAKHKLNRGYKLPS